MKPNDKTQTEIQTVINPILVAALRLSGRTWGLLSSRAIFLAPINFFNRISSIDEPEYFDHLSSMRRESSAGHSRIFDDEILIRMLCFRLLSS